ncbi:hypothetical protein F8S13_20730 [Chloroflexia bacterium SDU3-3]|nr:hypothetical protein F8S13_20730 [Chloroflexia bacterium SDU3-3]
MQTSPAWVLLLGLIGIATCAAPPTDQEETHIEQALTYAPQSTRSVIFTDWNMARHEAKMDSLNSDSPDADKNRFYQQQDQTWTSFSPSISALIDYRAQRWGTNVTDFVWSATLAIPSDPIDPTSTEVANVIRLKDSVDLDYVGHFILLNGYDLERNGSIGIYTATNASRQNLKRTSKPADLQLYQELQAFALLPEDRLLIAAHSRQSIDSILEVYEHPELSFRNKIGVSSMLDHMRGVSTALLQPFLDECREYRVGRIMAQLHENDQKAIEDALGASIAKLHDYSLLGFGYRMDGNQPTAIASIAYDSTSRMRDDHQTRVRLGTEGYTLKKHYSYQRTAFTTTPQETQALITTLVLKSDDPTAKTFHNMATAHDFLFAACN